MVVRCGFFVVWFFILPLLSMRALNSQRFSFSACSAMVYLRALQITTFNAPFFRRLCHKFESIFIARYSGTFYVSAFFSPFSLSLSVSPLLATTFLLIITDYTDVFLHHLCSYIISYLAKRLPSSSH